MPGRMKHHRRKSSRGGRIDQKPTDWRRSHPDKLCTLTYKQLKKRGKIIEQVSNRGRIRYNVIIDGTPRTITLDSDNVL